MRRSRRWSAAGLMALVGCGMCVPGPSGGSTSASGDVVLAVPDGPIAHLPEFGCVRREPLNEPEPAKRAGSENSVLHGTRVVSVITDALSGPCRGNRLTVLAFGIDRNGTADPALLVRALDAAVAHGADVVNISATFATDVPAVRAAIARTVSRDVLVIAAAGNFSGLPAGYPAAYPGVISVGSLSTTGTLSAFSARSGVTVAVRGEDVPARDGGGVRHTASGTSIAAAVVTGDAAARLLRGESPDAVLDAITTEHHYEGKP